MRLKDFKIFYFLLLSNFVLIGQSEISGTVIDKLTEAPVESVEIYLDNGQLISRTDSKGNYKFQVKNDSVSLIYFSYNYKPFKTSIFALKSAFLPIELESLAEQLSSVELAVVRKQYFSVKRLADVEDMAIYAGKKNEVVVMNNIFANLATNNARQIYSQIAGLNIYQNDDAGLQLNIGGRGLDPNRTSNFNTRQNGYDISADVLGYPESYYTPATEALSEIQIIRGAASLQYG
ncbi:MAG: carboxypeptidase-like regulatory domain-containing protein, partial [Bacteroidota bacterium]|nr:carboxypeptidase-like regulatory domain-containing protein [Bacteroidota bacterium]